MAVSQQELRNDLLQILSRLAGIDPAQVRDEQRLREDLGIDSLQSMELLSRICDRYGVDIEIEDVVDIQTVGDILAHIEKLIQAVPA